MKREKSLFAEIQDSPFYFDQTEFIFNLIENNPYHFVMMLRPSGFGKSSVASMLTDYFDISASKEKKSLFLNKAIGNYPDFNHKYQQKLPVIHLNFNTSQTTSYNLIVLKLIEQLKDVYEAYAITPYRYDQYLWHAMQGKLDQFNPATFLNDLLEALYDKYHKRVLIIFDDADFLLRLGFATNQITLYWKIVCRLLSVVNTSPAVFKAVLFSTFLPIYQMRDSAYDGFEAYSFFFPNPHLDAYLGITQATITAKLVQTPFNLTLEEINILLTQCSTFQCGEHILYRPTEIKACLQQTNLTIKHQDKKLVIGWLKTNNALQNSLKKVLQNQSVYFELDPYCDIKHSYFNYELTPINYYLTSLVLLGYLTYQEEKGGKKKISFPGLKIQQFFAYHMSNKSALMTNSIYKQIITFLDEGQEESSVHCTIM